MEVRIRKSGRAMLLDLIRDRRDLFKVTVDSLQRWIGGPQSDSPGVEKWFVHYKYESYGPAQRNVRTAKRYSDDMTLTPAQLAMCFEVKGDSFAKPDGSIGWVALTEVHQPKVEFSSYAVDGREFRESWPLERLSPTKEKLLKLDAFQKVKDGWKGEERYKLTVQFTAIAPAAGRSKWKIHFQTSPINGCSSWTPQTVEVTAQQLATALGISAGRVNGLDRQKVHAIALLTVDL